MNRQTCSRWQIPIALATVLLSILALEAPIWAYDVNKDLKNVGTAAASDITVILSGAETVIGHYDGYPSGRFNSFATGPNGPNTEMRWDNFQDGGNNMVDPGQIVHVGWSTQDHSSSVKDMYWTNQTGQRIPGSIIFNITSGWRYETAPRRFTALFDHNFDSLQPINISDFRFAVLASPIPLADLNNENSSLASMLSPPLVPDFQVLPGMPVEVVLPGEIEYGSAVVLRYGVTGSGGSAESLDFIQMVAVPEPSAWMLCLLATGLTWMATKRVAFSSTR